MSRLEHLNGLNYLLDVCWKRQKTLASLMNLMGSLKFLQLGKFDSEHDSLLPLQRLAGKAVLLLNEASW